MQEENLIQLIAQGDLNAFNQFYEKAHDRVYYLTKQYVKSDEDALEVVQDVFVAVYQHAVDLKNPEVWRSWLGKITINLALKKVNRNKIPDSASLDDEEADIQLPDEQAPDPGAILDQAETKRLLSEMIDHLPQAQRTAVLLYYFEEMRVAEIADAVQVSVGTVKSRLNYARNAIKKSVDNLERQGTKLHSITPMMLVSTLRMMAQGSMPSQAVVNTGAGLASLLENFVATTTNAASVTGAALECTEKAVSAASSVVKSLGTVGNQTVATVLPSSGLASSAAGSVAAGSVAAGSVAAGGVVAGGVAVKLVAGALVATLVCGGGTIAYHHANNAQDANLPTVAVEEPSAVIKSIPYEVQLQAYQAKVAELREGLSPKLEDYMVDGYDDRNSCLMLDLDQDGTNELAVWYQTQDYTACIGVYGLNVNGEVVELLSETPVAPAYNAPISLAIDAQVSWNPVEYEGKSYLAFSYDEFHGTTEKEEVYWLYSYQDGSITKDHLICGRTHMDVGSMGSTFTPMAYYINDTEISEEDFRSLQKSFNSNQLQTAVSFREFL